MNIENFIKEEARILKSTRRDIELAPDISDKHFEAIRRKYGTVLSEDYFKYVLVMSYTGTGFFFITGDAFYFNNFMQGGMKRIPFAEITGVKVEEGKVFSPDKIYLSTKSEDYELDGCVDGINIHVMKTVFMHIIGKIREGADTFSVSEQGVLSHQLPEEIKLIYLEILCNFAYINDKVIDSDEYNAITKFSIRMELQGDTRGNLRVYMNSYEERVKTGNLLREIKIKTKDQTGWWDAVKYCMMQDALYIHQIKSPGKTWREDGFLGSLMENCGLCPEQIETMCKAVVLNLKMQQKDAEMDKLKSEWRKLVKESKETKGYVPTRYLFCSGSIYGLKTYDGFLKKDETSQKAVNKQRELILQEIIINNQKAVNVLIGDMNYLAERLERALENEERIQKDYENIKKLLSRVKAAMGFVKQEEECRSAMPNKE